MCLAVPGLLLSRDDRTDVPSGRVSFNGLERDVCLAYVPHVMVGQYVLVHVGFAISVLDEAEALRTLALLEELGELGEPADSGAPDLLGGKDA